jgi:hypothetical protein
VLGYWYNITKFTCLTRAFDQPSIALRPAAVIRYRSTLIAGPPALMNAVVTVASPASTSPARISRQKPWANNVASVAPPGILASSRSARRCSAPRAGSSGSAGIVVPVSLLVGHHGGPDRTIASGQRMSPLRVIQTERREKAPGFSPTERPELTVGRQPDAPFTLRSLAGRL